MAQRIVLNLDICCGCRSCAAACAYGHWEQKYLGHGDIKPEADLPLHCLHCEQPDCAAACPNEAMRKDEDGVVRRSQFMCVGCKSCAVACPFGVIDNDLKYHIVPKCDLCSDRQKEGELPRCVSACTSGALQLVELDEAVHKVNLTGARVTSRTPGRRR